LLWDCVRVITREVKRLAEDAPTAVRGFRDHTRRARRRFQEINPYDAATASSATAAEVSRPDRASALSRS
jgi:hypothetical protein